MEQKEKRGGAKAGPAIYAGLGGPGSTLMSGASSEIEKSLISFFLIVEQAETASTSREILSLSIHMYQEVSPKSRHLTAVAPLAHTSLPCAHMHERSDLLKSFEF